MTTSPASWRNRQRCGAWRRWSRVAWHRRRCSQPSRRRSASSSTSTARTSVATSRTARQPPLRAGAEEATSSHSAPGSRSTTTVSSPGCCAPVGPNAWTTTRTCPARSPRARGHSAFAARLESRLRSKAASGASWPSPRDRTSRCRLTPRRAWQSFCDLAATAVSNSEARHPGQAARGRAGHAAPRRHPGGAGVSAGRGVLHGRAAARGQLLGPRAHVRALLRRRPRRSPRSRIATPARSAARRCGTGTSTPLDGDNLTAWVLRTGRAGQDRRLRRRPRPDRGVRARAGHTRAASRPRSGSAAASGARWSTPRRTAQGPLPEDVEVRLGPFGELVATAIGNAEGWAEVTRLAAGAGGVEAGGDVGREGGAARSPCSTGWRRRPSCSWSADHVGYAGYESGAQLTVLSHLRGSPDRGGGGLRVRLDGDSVDNARVRVRSGLPGWTTTNGRAGWMG